MTEPKLIRLVPTGELVKGVELCEPQEVIGFARALEREHGIDRRYDA